MPNTFENALTTLATANRRAQEKSEEMSDTHLLLAAPLAEGSRFVPGKAIVLTMTLAVAEAIEAVQETIPEGFGAIDLALPVFACHSVNIAKSLLAPPAIGGPSVINPFVMPASVDALTPLGVMGRGTGVYKFDATDFVVSSSLSISRNEVDLTVVFPRGEGDFLYPGSNMKTCSLDNIRIAGARLFNLADAARTALAMSVEEAGSVDFRVFGPWRQMQEVRKNFFDAFTQLCFR